MTLLDLDIRTVLRLLFFGNLIAMTMLAAYKNQEDASNPLRLFLCGKGFQASAWLLLSLRGTIAFWLSADISNSFLFIGFTLEMLAFTRLRASGRQFDAMLTGMAACGGILLWVIGPLPGVRVAVASIVVSGIYAAGAILMLRTPGVSRLQKVIAGFFLTFCTVLLLRAYQGFSSGIGLLSENGIQSLTFLALFGFMLVGGIGFLLLMKEKQDEDLLLAATTDPLTGILNRRAFMTHAEIAFNIAMRNSTPMSLLSIDIDHFKQINDTYGHPVGDRVLQAFVQNVRQQIRPHDIFSRFGGEEFAILIFNSLESARFIADRIRLSCADQTIEGAPEVRYTISIGIDSRVPKSQDDLEMMLQQSDIALYHAKNHGRNQLCIAHGQADDDKLKAIRRGQ